MDPWKEFRSLFDSQLSSVIDVIEASARFDQKPRLIENAGVKCEFSRLVLNFCSKSHCRQKLTASVRWRVKDTTHKTMRVRGAPQQCGKSSANGSNIVALPLRTRNKRTVGSCWLKSLTGFKLCETTPNDKHQHARECANRSNIHQCWEFLGKNVTSVCTGIYKIFVVLTTKFVSFAFYLSL